MPDPLAHSPDMITIRPNTKPPLWWLFPWSYARTLHISANALKAYADKSDRIIDAQQRVIENLDTSGTAGQAVFELNWEKDAAFADADENRLEQVYWNLLSNAIRHGESNTPLIQINARLEGEWVEISIADNGTGIPLEDQAHIFERFYRVHKHRARDAGGTGLGLSIVKNIILAHGGQISLRSTPGDGATFIIRLPVSQKEILPAR